MWWKKKGYVGWMKRTREDWIRAVPEEMPGGRIPLLFVYVCTCVALFKKDGEQIGPMHMVLWNGWASV